MTRLRAVIGLVAVLGLLAIGATIAGRSSHRPAPTTTAVSTPAATPPVVGATKPPLVVPTPAIPLPTTCPSQTAAQVNNPARYTFCTPIGWAAYNENNSIPTTYLMRPKAGTSPVIAPTDYDRLQILIVVNPPPLTNLPDQCFGQANDTIAGLPTRHCQVTLDPSTNLVHGERVEFWIVSLPGGKQFDISATVGTGSSEEDQQMMSTIVHNVRPAAG